ncbi:hypothetical protein HN510_03125 [Candidatus Woesearchaeota archaeon]|jgi:hypothetical protein|nr:hypothetical protein [Candidatus Woesearchaeota archaeon]
MTFDTKVGKQEQDQRTYDNTAEARRVILLNSSGNANDSDNPLFVHGAGETSTLNSHAEFLLANVTFTGTAEDIKNESVIIVTVKSDKASATDGLSIQWSPDGINWDGSDVFTIPAATQKTFTFQPVNRYFRVVYTNGGDDQTYFRLQTQLKSSYIKPSSHRIQDAIIDEDDAELVTNVNKAKKPDGTFVNIGATASGNLRVTDVENGLAIVKGDVSNTTFVHKFGNAPDFDTGDGTIDVWDGANDAGLDEMVYTYSTSAAIDTLSSSDNSDTVDIEVQGLDANYDLVIQTKTLQGQTQVTLDTPLIRVFRLKNVSSTDVGGQVYCFEQTADAGGDGIPDDTTKVRAIMNNGNNQTLMAIYTIPAGKTGYMRSFFAGTAGAKKTTNYVIDLYARPFGQVFQLKHKSALADTGTTYWNHMYAEPEVFTEKTDIVIRAQVTEAAITLASVSAGFDIVLVDN